MAIAYYTENTKLPKQFQKRKLTQWIKEIANSKNKKADNITYLFCTDEKILEINRNFLKHDYYTDIITFDYTEDNLLAGDIFISIDTVKSNAAKFNSDYIEELYRVMIHGILHLCGMKDRTEEEKKKITQAENKALEILRKMIEF